MVSAELGDRLDGAADAGRVRQVEGGDIRPRFRESDREALADTAAGPRDEGDIAVETEDVHGCSFAVLNEWPVP